MFLSNRKEPEEGAEFAKRSDWEFHLLTAHEFIRGSKKRVNKTANRFNGLITEAF